MGVEWRNRTLSQHPERVHVFVDTCYPDPYFFYEIMFEDMVAVNARGEVQ